MKKSALLVTSAIASLIVAGASLTAFSSQTDQEDDANNPELVSQAAVSMEQAITIALAEVPGKVTESEIEEEDGTLVWEVEVLGSDNNEYELKIDANDGRVLEKELDD